MKSIYILYHFLMGSAFWPSGKQPNILTIFFRIIIPRSPIPYAPQAEQLYLQAKPLTELSKPFPKLFLNGRLSNRYARFKRVGKKIKKYFQLHELDQNPIQ